MTTGRRASGFGRRCVPVGPVALLAACAGAAEPTPRVQPMPREEWLVEGPVAADLDRAQLVERFGAPTRVESRATPNRHDPSVTDSIVVLDYAGARYVYYVVTQGGYALLDDALIRDPSHLRHAAPGIGTPADSLRAWWGEPMAGSATTLEYDCTSCEVPHPATFVIEGGVGREIRFDFYVGLMSDADAPLTAGVRFPPPLVYAAGLIAGWLLERALDMPPLDELWSGILSIVCFVAGGALAFSALGLFRIAGTNPLPMRPTTSLVLRGPYRFTRNPMYVGMAFVYAGFALLFDLRWALLLLPLVLLVIHTQVIAREERYLEAKFGDEYRAYRTRVRRWL